MSIGAYQHRTSRGRRSSPKGAPNERAASGRLVRGLSDPNGPSWNFRCGSPGESAHRGSVVEMQVDKALAVFGGRLHRVDVAPDEVAGKPREAFLVGRKLLGGGARGWK